MKSEDTPIQGEIAERGNAEAGTSFSWLWVPALLFFGFGDTLTSYLVFAAGGREANPFLAAVMHPFGGVAFDNRGPSGCRWAQSPTADPNVTPRIDGAKITYLYLLHILT